VFYTIEQSLSFFDFADAADEEEDGEEECPVAPPRARLSAASSAASRAPAARRSFSLTTTRGFDCPSGAGGIASNARGSETSEKRVCAEGISCPRLKAAARARSRSNASEFGLVSWDDEEGLAAAAAVFKLICDASATSRARNDSSSVSFVNLKLPSQKRVLLRTAQSSVGSRVSHTMDETSAKAAAVTSVYNRF
jgi:hypothetical protein